MIIGTLTQREEGCLYATTIVTPKDDIGRASYTKVKGPFKNYMDISTELWHHRLTHPNKSVTTHMFESDAYCMTSSKREESQLCVTITTTK